MAKNLQSKLSPSDTIRLFDINKGAMDKLSREMEASSPGGAVVALAESALDASNQAVSDGLAFPSSSRFCPVTPHMMNSFFPNTV